MRRVPKGRHKPQPAGFHEKRLFRTLFSPLAGNSKQFTDASTVEFCADRSRVSGAGWLLICGQNALARPAAGRNTATPLHVVYPPRPLDKQEEAKGLTLLLPPSLGKIGR